MIKKTGMALTTLFFYISPFLLGIVPHMFLAAYFSIGACAVLYLILDGARAWANKTILSLLAIMIFISLCDLIARPLTKHLLYYRPDEMFIHMWPAQPILARYQKNVHYEGTTFGDLAAKTGKPDYRDYRTITFITDSNGFRNDPAAPPQPIDLILNGDSFGVGTGTTQEKTLAAALHSEFNLNVYNISMTGNPYQEFLNLKTMQPLLQMHTNTVMLWLLFSGNDLFGDFPDDYNPSDQNGWAQALTALTTFRNRSPTREFLRRWASNFTHEQAGGHVLIKDFMNGKKMLFYSPYLWLKNSKLEDITSHINYPKMIRTFDETKKLTDEKKLKLIVAVVPTKAEVYPWVADESVPWQPNDHISGFALAVQQWCTQNHIPYLDLKPDFINEAPNLYKHSGQILWWYDDTHWNENGQHLAAQIIYDRLLKNIVKP